MNHEISVIMAVFNEEERWLKKSIESVLSQTFTNFEFIIILDNPENLELYNIINKYAKDDKRVKFHVNDKNIGLIKTLNKGLGLANGKYVARMDADDICLKNRLELQYEYMEKNQYVDLIGTKVEYINENDEKIICENILPYRYEEIKQCLKYGNCTNHPTWMVKLDVIMANNIKGYSDMKYVEDYDLITRLIINGYKVENLEDITLKYRVRNNSISRSNFKKQLQMSFLVTDIYKSYLNGKNISKESIKIRKEKILNRREYRISSELLNRKSKFLKVASIILNPCIVKKSVYRKMRERYLSDQKKVK